MQKILFLNIVSLIAMSWAASAVPGRRASAVERERKLVQELECKYNLVTIEIMEKDLIRLMGEADQELDEAHYGSGRAEELAIEIRRLANLLILKTSTDNKLGLEAFLFAREISRKS